MKISIAFVKDIPKIIEISEATWQHTYAPIISQEQIDFMYERMYSAAAILQQMQEGHTFLLYNDDNQTLGFISYFIREDQTLYISKLYVKPKIQKSRIGKKLLGELQKIAKKNK